jgi:hypothetical protein
MSMPMYERAKQYASAVSEQLRVFAKSMIPSPLEQFAYASSTRGGYDSPIMMSAMSHNAFGGNSQHRPRKEGYTNGGTPKGHKLVKQSQKFEWNGVPVVLEYFMEGCVRILVYQDEGHAFPQARASAKHRGEPVTLRAKAYINPLHIEQSGASRLSHELHNAGLRDYLHNAKFVEEGGRFLDQIRKQEAKERGH